VLRVKRYGKAMTKRLTDEEKRQRKEERERKELERHRELDAVILKVMRKQGLLPPLH
jgi:hypothetical protein